MKPARAIGWRQRIRRIWSAHDSVIGENVQAVRESPQTFVNANVVDWCIAGPTDPPGVLAAKCIIIAHKSASQ